MTKKIELKTERLLLRPLTLDDADALFEYRSDSEINKYQGWIPKTVGEVHYFIQNRVSPELDMVNTWFQFVIIHTESKKVIGDVGIHFLDEEKKQVEIGCTIHSNYQRKAFATEALTETINFLFSSLNKHRITTSIDPDNHGSIRLVEGLGFIKEAHFRKSILVNGQWVDDVIYALLHSDWQNKSQ